MGESCGRAELLRKRAGPSSVPETKLMYKCISESNTLPITLWITPNNSLSRNGTLILNLHHRGFYHRPVSRSETRTSSLDSWRDREIEWVGALKELNC
jgi:hypothetical protein